MPSVSYNGQSFVVDGRKLWLLAASLQYARIPPELWAERIAAAKQAGFNTIETACPWCLHEPRRGRITLEGPADVRRFVELCGDAGMRVILRPGPFVGSGFDGGGLPSWLAEEEDVALRESNPRFMKFASRYFRKLFGALAPLQETKGGPIVLVQVEHQWTCANDEQAEKYLREVARIIRESGMTVPLVNRNNLWTDNAGTIDTWSGDDDLLANLRQLRVVQPDAPRLVSVFEAESYATWGRTPDPVDAPTVLRRIAEVLAAGAQPIVTPFHGGTNFGFLGGRLPGPAGGGVTTSAAAGALLGEAGARGPAYHLARRIITFANHFGHVLGELDPEYQPVAMDPRELAGGRATGNGRPTAVSIVPQRGAGGRIVFVFASGRGAKTTLLMDNGIRLPVSLGEQPVGWFVLDVDLHGQGRLNYSNLCPFAIIDRGLVVLFGPAKTAAFFSVDGTPADATVPSGSKPTVVEHKGLTFLICNEAQIDATYHDDERVYVGVAGLDVEGRPLPAPGWSKAWSVAPGGEPEPIAFDAAVSRAAGNGGRAQSVRLSGWRGGSSEAHVGGTSPRYASLAGPQSLPACGAPTGYGWYRMRLKIAATKKRKIHLPQVEHRAHLYLDGALAGVIGDGPGSDPGPLDCSLAKGEHVLTALVDNDGRFADGNDLAQHVGLAGHVYEVKTIAGARGKRVTSKPVDPFAVRQFILGGSSHHRSDSNQMEWSFAHARKTPVLLDIRGALPHGTVVLNDQPIAYYAGQTGGRRLRLLLEPAKVDAFKRGKNVIRFAPDVGQPGALDEMAKTATVYECTASLTDGADWAFAKWEAPAASKLEPVTANTKSRGVPWWWHCTFPAPAGERPCWFQTTGLSKGHVTVNGHGLGRYFTATRTGKQVGPQTRLFVPRAWLHEDAPNEILVFDEHGFSPLKTKLVLNETGDLD